MVATRGRITALSFVAILVLATIPAFVPVAGAQAPPAPHGSVSVPSLTVVRAGAAAPYSASLAPLLPTDVLQFRWDVSWGTTGCTGQLPGTDPAVTWSTTTGANALPRIDATRIGGSASASPTVTGAGTSRAIFYNQTVATATTNASNGQAPSNITLLYQLSCNSAPTATTTVGWFPSTEFVADTQAPSLTIGTVAFPGGSRASTGNMAKGAIGSTLTLPITTDSTILEWDLRNVTGSTAGYVALTPGADATVVIPEAGGIVPPIPDAAVNVPVRVRDSNLASANVREQIVSVTIDNVRPTATLTPGAATLILSENDALTAGSELSSVIAAVGALPAGVAAAQLQVDGVGRANGTGSITGSFPLSDPFSWTPSVQLAAVDAAGNVANNAVALTFPAMEVKFGVDGLSPDFIGGNALDRVWVNVTPGGASPAALGYANPQQSKLNFTLKKFGTSGFLYWKNGTSGSTDADFAAVQPDVTRPGGAAYTTTFQPASSVTGTTVAGGLVLTNLTNGVLGQTRSFNDGAYVLEANLTGTNGNVVTHLLRFRVDSQDPVLGNARNYTSPAAGPTGTNVLHGSDGNPVRVLVNVTDWRTSKDSGLRNITVELIDPVTKAVAPLAGGSGVASINIDRDACGTTLEYCKNLITNPTPCSPGDATTCAAYATRVSKGDQSFTFINATPLQPSTWVGFSGWVNTTFPDLPVGIYAVRVLAYDQAGRVKAQEYTASSDLYRVAPSVRINESSTSPVLDGARLKVEVGASQRMDPVPAEMAAYCSSGDWCPADYVQLYVTNDPTASIGSAAVKAWDNRSYFLASGGYSAVNVAGFSGRNQVNGTLNQTTNAIRYYELVGNNPPELTGPNFAGIDVTRAVYVKAVAGRVLANGTHVQSPTDWIRVPSATAPALEVLQPPAPWSIAFNGSAPKDRIPYNLTFDRKTTPATPPTLTLVITDLSSGTTHTFANLAARPNAVASPRNFNWTGNFTTVSGNGLPPGTYSAAFQVMENGVQLAPTATTQFIVVSSATPPRVVVNGADQEGREGVYVTGPNSAPTIYARQTFDLAFYVEHGEANLTSVDQLKFSLKRANGAVIAEDTGGFSVDVRPGSVLSEIERVSYFNATVRLPDGAADAEVFQLSITAEIDQWPYRMGNFSAFPRIVIDNQPPTGSGNPTLAALTVLADANTNAAPPALKPYFLGTALDNGSGIKRIDVRIVNISSGRAINPIGDTFVPADANADAWFTSDLITSGDHQLRHVWVYRDNADPPGVLRWQLNTTARQVIRNGAQAEALPTNMISDQDLNRTYRVDVRFVDNVGQVSPINDTYVVFDPVGPRVGYNGALGSTPSLKSGIESATTLVDWHGSAILTVNATDNNCLKAVRLVGRSDANPNAIVKADMTLVGASACAKNQTMRWRIDLATAPQMTNDVSNYTYWFEAEDASGKVAEVPAAYRTFRMQVRDATPAQLQSLTVTPATVGAGTRARIEAFVFENQRVMNVSIVARHASNGTIAAVGHMTPDPARPVSSTGTGWWIADTQDNLSLALDVGEYGFEVVARDANYNTTCPAAACSKLTTLLKVVADAPPQIVQESPARGTTLVGAQPTLKFQVLDRNVESSGIAVRAGVNGTLATVNVTLAEIKAPNGSRQGYTVAYTPAAALAHGNDLVVRVTASSTKGFTNETTFNFTVDAIAPNATANLTGTQLVANRTWAVSATRVALASAETGATLLYKINGGETQTYAGPLSPAGDEGEWRLEYWARDAAGNNGPAQTANVSLDRKGPKIDVVKHGDDLVVTVSDGASGVGLDEGNVTVYYSYGETGAFVAKKLSKLTGNSFSATLPGNATSTGLRYYFEARDLLGNVGTLYAAAQPYLIKKETGRTDVPLNLGPTVAITFPVNSPTVRDSIEVKWLAQDPEDAPLTISIAIKEKSTVLVPAAENSGSYVINTSAFAAGTYTVVVTASDGNNSENAEATFVVARGDAVQVVAKPPTTVEPNEAVSFSVAIASAGKTVSSATYSLVKDNRVVQSGQLRESEGVYKGAVTPTEPGQYRVVVSVGYEDGTSEAPKSVAGFTVAGGEVAPAKGLAMPPLGFSMVALLALAVIALAAVGLGRWRK